MNSTAFGAPTAAAAAGATPAAAPAFGGFGAPAAPTAAAAGTTPAAAPAFGGFGAPAAGTAAPTAAAAGATPAAAPAFGGFGAPAAGTAAAAAGTTPAAAPAFGGFQVTKTTTNITMTGLATEGTTVTAPNAVAPTITPSAASEFAGKTLAWILSRLDHNYFKDHEAFCDLARHVRLRDRQILDRGKEISAFQEKVKDALASSRATAATLQECKERQAAMDRLLSDFEAAVSPVYEAAVARFSDADRARVRAYDAALALANEVQSVEQRVDRMVWQHNYWKRNVQRMTDVDRMVGVVDGQLDALRECVRLSMLLERELEYLLGPAAADE